MKHTALYYFRTMAAATAAVIAMASSGCEDNTEPEDYNDAGSVSALSISPTSKTLGSGDTYAAFTASGGTPPYSWTVSDTSLGTVPDTDFATVTYSREGSTEGANVVRVQDSNGWYAEAIVTQDESAGTP